MDEKKINAVKDYFERKMIQYKGEATFLISDNRMDEADFIKVQLNVFDIFNTIFFVALKLCGRNGGDVRDYFLEKIEEIPKNWIISLQRAERYGDMKKACVEKIKSDTVDQIKKEFRELWEFTYD